MTGNPEQDAQAAPDAGDLVAIVTDLRRRCGHDSRSVDGCLDCEAADSIEQQAAIIAAKQREKDLAGIKDTVTFWKKNRLLGISASMASSGYENIDILRAFDEIAAAIRGQE